jgi:hypothetical protein
MANLSFTTNNQIIRDLYNTPADAIEASKELGCDGYRTYIINNQTKYVPCSSFVQYENALRYRVVQGKVGAFANDTFGNKLVGLQFANSKDEIQGDPFFTLGNFSLQKNVQKTTPRSLDIQINESNQNTTPKKFTIDGIAQRNLEIFNGKPYIETLKSKVDKNLTVSVLFDKRKLDNYVLFSSLKERIKNVIIEIYNNYPAAIKLEPFSITIPSVSEYVNYSIENTSTFKVGINNIFNPFNIEFLASGTTVNDSELITKYRNLTKTFTDYVVYYNGVEYPIIGAQFPLNRYDNVTGIRLTVIGNPFGNITDLNDSANIRYFIKPKSSIYNTFFNDLSDLAGFLLNKDLDGEFVSEFLYPTVDENGKLVTIKETLTFPILDEFNIDLFTDRFDQYTTNLNDFAESYDSVKTNLISRFLTTDSLKEFDTEDRKMNMIFQLYGKTFDDVKKYIDGITFMRNVSYDKIQNIPDLLIKNYATMLGFKTFEIEDEDTLLSSLFSTDLNVEKSTTPAEIDIELWRRILINSFYLFKSKGTRKSIELILKMVGLPEEIFELNEYIYLADRPLNTPDVLNKIYGNNIIDEPETLINLVPFDINGFPTTPLNIRYQENGGFISEDKLNIGVYDFGQRYINEYKKFQGVYLFDLYRTVDNVKSWVYSENLTNYYKDSKNGLTEYESLHSNLTINSKELEVYLSSNRIFDVPVYRQYVRNIGMVNADLNILTKFDSTELTFNQFLKKSLDGFINPNNRKTIKTYPSLSKVYFDYLKTTNNPIDSIRSLEFLNKFDSTWVKLIEQFVPATSIVNAGKKIQNSTFLDNKHVYKHGLNTDVSWLGTDGSEFQQKALKPVFLGTTNVTENVGVITETIIGDNITFNISGKPGEKISGVDPTINEYFGFHYTMFEYCDSNAGVFYIWESGVDYGDDSLFDGNINQTNYDVNTQRRGVFVVYDGSLYRLNTKYLFQGTGHLPNIHTSGTGSTIESSSPPNVATVKNSLNVVKKIWDKIPLDADARNITFSDNISLDIRNDERSFYLNSIGRGLSYLQIGVDFDCPPPKPHVCYYDFSGKVINIELKTVPETYIDEYGDTQTIKQPKFYGYSRDYSLSKPINIKYGSIGEWVIAYKKRLPWIDGNVYYNGEIIANIHPTNPENLVSNSKVFLVTGTTVTGTTSYPTTSGSGLKLIGTALTPGSTGTTINPTTISNGTPGGMYGRYQDRVKTDPFMHVDPAFISKINLNPNSDFHSINLSKSINLSQIFKGDTPETTFKVKDNILNGELFISDSITMNFEGFYNLDENGVGPFYKLEDDNIFIHTLEDSISLQPNVNNYISIQSLNENFTTIGNDLTLIASTPGHYLVTKNSYLNFNFELYFESNESVIQTVKIKLLNSNSFVFSEQTFTFNGDDDIQLRQYVFNYSGFFNSNEKVYLVVEPINLPCTLSRYETIEYNHLDVSESEYEQLNDPRFRLLHNSGFSGKGEYLDGYSIKPIHNESNLVVNNLITRSNENQYVNIPILGIEHSLDPNYLYNKLFLNYFGNNTSDNLVYDTTLYDKKLNFDKINFNFKVRSKSGEFIKPSLAQSSATSTKNIGVKTANVEFNLSFNDYYLGNKPNQTDYSDITNAITIGKLIRPRKNNHNRQFTYAPKFSFYNNDNLGDSTNNVLGNFIGYDNGLNDYTNYNLSNDIVTELRNKKRVQLGVPGSGTYKIYALENDIYNTEIYKSLLNVVPEFNPQIVNYELNDIVKLRIDDYKLITTGTTVNVIPTERLFICVNDITNKHCYKIKNGSEVVQGEIHEIYQPLGSRSCFVELERYNPNNFTPWGYEDAPLQTTNNPNVIDYIYRNYITFDQTLIDSYNYGDLFVAEYDNNDEFFRFIYQKPLQWVSDKKYYRGDFVLVKVTGVTDFFRFYVAKLDNDNKNPSLVTSTTYWRLIDTDSDLFDHKSIIGISGWLNSLNTSWLDLDKFTAYSTTAARLPKTLPVNDYGIPFISTGTTISGVTFNERWNNVLIPDGCYIDNAYQSFDRYDVNSVKKILRGTDMGSRYYGSDMFNELPYNNYSNTVTYEIGDIVKNNGIAYIKTSNTQTTPSVGDHWQMYYPGMLISGSVKKTDNYFDYYGNTRLNNTNIKLTPSVPFLNSNYSTPYIVPFITESAHVYPLFERLGRVTEKNNPTLFVPDLIGVTGLTYNVNSDYLGFKYTVNRGVLYKYIGTSPNNIFMLQPYEDIENWVEKDFCLVNNFKFFKDRTKVTITESKILSITEDVKSNLYFFNKNLQLKTGFTNRSFTGDTINQKLLTPLDKFYDLTDNNRRFIRQNGSVNFKSLNGDLIMDYYPDRDELGYPLTGEFMGKLRVSNPCGQVATTFFGILFDTDVNALSRTEGFVSANVVPETTEILPYVVRVIVTQNGQANATLKIKQTKVDLNDTTENISIGRSTIFDTKYNVVPETNFEVEISYNIDRKQTKFNSAFVNNVGVFINNEIVNTNTLETMITTNKSVESRIIKLKNLTSNKTIFINLDGIVSITDVRDNIAQVGSLFNVKPININTSLL